MDLPSGHRSSHGVPDSRLNSRCLVCDDQDVLAVIALKVLALIGRETNREVVIVAELQLGGLELGVGNLGAFDQSMDLRPELRTHLTLRRRSREDDALMIARKTPE